MSKNNTYTNINYINQEDINGNQIEINKNGINNIDKININNNKCIVL